MNETTDKSAAKALNLTVIGLTTLFIITLAVTRCDVAERHPGIPAVQPPNVEGDAPPNQQAPR